MKNPKVLVACEESQRVCMAFRERGIEAYSCDIQEPSGGHPEWHICGDVIPVLEGGTVTTMDGQQHKVGKWDLIIAHPPCTYISRAGSNRWLRKGGVIKDYSRYIKSLKAVILFVSILSSDVEHIAIENPVPMKKVLPIPYSQIIQPYYFGSPYMKTTCLWLKGLPLLNKENEVIPTMKWVMSTDHRRCKQKDIWQTSGKSDQKERSKTFPEIARAFARQWGDYLLGLEET